MDEDGPSIYLSCHTLVYNLPPLAAMSKIKGYRGPHRLHAGSDLMRVNKLDTPPSTEC